MKIRFRRKLRVDGIRVMLTTVESRNVGLPVCFVKTKKIRIYKTIILPLVLYWCETWFLTLREEHRLRVCENRVLRRIFGLERNEVTGRWRKIV
jgi:hypothetical protein